MGALALEKFVSTPYISDDNDSGDGFLLHSFTVFSFGAVVFGDIDCCKLRPINGQALYLYLCLYLYFVYDATGAAVELVVVG